MSIEDVEAIKRLKYRYIRTLDQHDWDAYADCFTVDATASFSSEASAEALVFQGRDALVRGISDSMDNPLKVSMHQVHHPEVELVDVSYARGRWYLQDQVFCEEQKWMLNGTAFYQDEYRCVDGRWLISHTGYERVFEYLSALPKGFRLISLSKKIKAGAKSQPS